MILKYRIYRLTLHAKTVMRESDILKVFTACVDVSCTVGMEKQVLDLVAELIQEQNV